MGKRHSQDQLYLNRSELASAGARQAAAAGQDFRQLPYDCCCLTLLPFKSPYCTANGIIFDREAIEGYAKQYKKSPVDGSAMSGNADTDLIKLNVMVNQEGSYHCPITMKVFNNNSHIVAIKTTGNVYAYDAILELCIKPLTFVDLITNEPFAQSDMITLNDPQNKELNKRRDLNTFVHLQMVRDMNNSVGNGEDENGVQNSSGASSNTTCASSNKIRHTATSEMILKEIERSRESSEAKDAELKRKIYMGGYNSGATDKIDDYSDISALMALGALVSDVNGGASATTGSTSSSFTSSAVGVSYGTHIREATGEEVREAKWTAIRKVGKKAYVQLQTSFGNINLEVHCDINPRTSWNFLELCRRGYYNGSAFHRLVQNFMVQGGDPGGDGSGGESAFPHGAPFRDEFDQRLRHDARGVVSMANSGKNSNGSQFFITFKEAPFLDTKHSIIGKVVGGMKTLDMIEDVRSDAKERPYSEICLLQAHVFEDPCVEGEARLVRQIKASMEARAAKARPAVVAVAAKTPSGIGKYVPTTAAASGAAAAGTAAVAPGEDVAAFLARNGSNSFMGGEPLKKKHKQGFDAFN